MELSQTQPLDVEEIPDVAISNPEHQVACLRVLAQKGNEAKCWPILCDKNVVGSNSDVCHVHISSKAVSNRHAVIEVDGQTHLIYDLHSTNHTYRGKMALKPEVRYEIRNGDLLSFANIICQYLISHKHNDKSRDARSGDKNSEVDNRADLKNSVVCDSVVASKAQKEKTDSESEPPIVIPAQKGKHVSFLPSPEIQVKAGNSKDDDPQRDAADTDSDTRDGFDICDMPTQPYWANLQTQPVVLSDDNSPTRKYDEDAPTQLFDVQFWQDKSEAAKDLSPEHTSALASIKNNACNLQSDEEDMLQELSAVAVVGKEANTLTPSNAEKSGMENKGLSELETQLVDTGDGDLNTIAQKCDIADGRRSAKITKNKPALKNCDSSGDQSVPKTNENSESVKKSTLKPSQQAGKEEMPGLLETEKPPTKDGREGLKSNVEMGESSGIGRKRRLKKKVVPLPKESEEDGDNEFEIDNVQPDLVAKRPLKKKKLDDSANSDDVKEQQDDSGIGMSAKTVTRSKKQKVNVPGESEWISPKTRSPKDPCKSPLCPKVMFTGLSDLKWSKVVKSLGGEVTDSVFDCTNLVTDKVRRTCKLLCLVARGKPIVSQQWLQECEKSRKFVECTPYLVKDTAAEEKYGFILSESIKKAAQRPLLDGYVVHATAGVTPEPEDIKKIVECSGGQYISRLPSPTRAKGNTIIISVPENENIYKSAQSAGISVVGTELLLSGVLRQRLDFKKYILSPSVEPGKSRKLASSSRTK